VRIDTSAWRLPEIFRWLKESAALDDAELRRTFNCGIGMSVCVAEEHADAARNILQQQGEECWPIGIIEPADSESAQVIYE